MKPTLKFIFLLLINTFCINITLAQTSTKEIDTTSESEFNLPPLQVIIDSVISRNGMVRFRKQHIEVQASKLSTEKIFWTKNFGIQVDSRYGTFNNSTLGADGGINTPINVSTNSTQLSYGVGFYLKLPIFDIINRKHQVKMAKMELEESKSMLKFQEDEVRQATIRLYQDLILKQKILKIKSESLGNGKANIQMVEKEFRNGLVPIAEYVRISSITTNMETDYEEAKSEYLVAKQILEDMAGFVFNVPPTK